MAVCPHFGCDPKMRDFFFLLVHLLITLAQLNQLLRSFHRQVEEIQPEGYILQGSVIRRNLQRQVGMI
jgi:hypothetical protein